MFDIREFRNKPLPLESEILSTWINRARSPVVSVLCNTFNHKEYLEDALRGFLIQRTNFPFEIIIHDDASTDGAIDIIGDYARRYPNLIRPIIQTVNQFSKGKKPTITALKFARGKYIAFCEGDDFWTNEEKLQLQHDVLSSSARYSGCTGHTWVYSDGRMTTSGELIAKRTITRKDLLLGRKRECRFCSLMVRRDALPADWPKEYKLAFAGDNFLRIMVAGIGDICVLPKYIACYRIHQGGIWSSLRGSRLEEQKLHDLLLLKNIVPDSEHSYIDWRIAIMRVMGRDKNYHTIGARLHSVVDLVSSPAIAIYVSSKMLGTAAARICTIIANKLL